MRKVVPERRFVTVLFADIKGFTSLSENLDPEDVEDIINSIFARFREIIEEHGGYLDKFIGDAVMAVFGAPHSHSDDPRRAILSGLQMQKALKEFNEKHNLSLGVRIGINTGEVLWSSIAGEKPTVMGDAVNVAQRLESIGEPGKVFVSEKTMELASEYFDFEYKGETKVKGRKEPVRVYVVLGEKEHVFLPRGGILTPFFERDGELGTLMEAFEEVAGKKVFKTVLVYGDAGIGKTRLAVEFLKKIKRKHDIETILVRADALKQGSYQIVSRIITEKLAITRSEELENRVFSLFSKKENLSEAEIKTFTSLVLSAVYPSRTERSSMKNVLKERPNALYMLFEIMFSHEEKPAVIVIDDFHHVDEESLDFVIGLRKRLKNAPLLLIANSRKMFKSLNPDVEIALSPLSKKTLYAFLKFIFDVKDEKIDPSFVDFIKEKTGGNPYYVEELLKYIKERGLFERNPLRAKETDLHLPESLKGILTERIDALPPKEKEVAKTAACIGRVFWKNILEVVRDKPVEKSLLRLELEGIVEKEAKSLVENDTEYAFIHELLRDAAYELLTKKERIRLHNKIGSILESYRDNPILLHDAGRHFLLAQEPDKAKELFEKAGDVARDQANYKFALQCYNKIEEPSPSLLLKKAHVLQILSRYREAAQVVLHALSILQEGEDRDIYARLKIRLASIKEKEGDFVNALKELEELQDWPNPVLKAEILGRIAWIMFRLSRFSESEEKARMALEIIHKMNSQDKEILVRKSMCLNILANIYMKKGDLQSAYKYFEEVMSISRSFGDKDRLSRVLINMSTYLIYVKDFDKALSFLNEALSLTTVTANRGLLPAIYNNIGLIYLEKREPGKAIINFKRALKITRNLGNRFMEMNVLVNMGRAYSIMESYGEAIFHFKKALEIARASRNKMAEGIALANIAYNYYLKGDAHVAEKYVRDSISVFRELGDLRSEIYNSLPILIYSLYDQDRIDEAMATIDEYLQFLKSKNMENETEKLLVMKAIGYYLKKEYSRASSLLSKIKVKLLDGTISVLFVILAGLLSVMDEGKLKHLLKDVKEDEKKKLFSAFKAIKEGGDPLFYYSDNNLLKRVFEKIQFHR